MDEHVSAQLMMHLLSALPDAEAAAVATHLARCAPCRAERAALEDAWQALALAPTPVVPRPALRQRLLDRLAAEPVPDPTFLDRVARLFDLGLAEAKKWLSSIADPEAWVPALPGVRLMHIPPGPAAVGADCGFVAIAAGERFPHHRHRGVETALILSGSVLDIPPPGRGAPAVHHPGAVVVAEADSEHELLALEDLVFAVTVFSGVQILVGDVQITE